MKNLRDISDLSFRKKKTSTLMELTISFQMKSTVPASYHTYDGEEYSHVFFT